MINHTSNVPFVPQFMSDAAGNLSLGDSQQHPPEVFPVLPEKFLFTDHQKQAAKGTRRHIVLVIATTNIGWQTPPCQSPHSRAEMLIHSVRGSFVSRLQMPQPLTGAPSEAVLSFFDGGMKDDHSTKRDSEDF